MLKKWQDIPEFMRTQEVKRYYDILDKKRVQLFIKRLFDIAFSLILLVIFALPILIIAIIIKLDSKGPVFYRQERVTAYGKKFRIHKFRTMVNNADKIGTAVTVSEDKRITKVGAKIRKYRIDEIPQLIDVLIGNMSFVGTRPEAVQYVERYKPEYFATLLLPAGITSEASIKFKDEAVLLRNEEDTNSSYIKRVLPLKMQINLKEIESFSLFKDFMIALKTFFCLWR